MKNRIIIPAFVFLAFVVHTLTVAQQAPQRIFDEMRNLAAEPVVALRADMDALPITEETGLPFASTVTAIVNGQEVGVMHACGHDLHTSSLMGVASVLAAVKDELPGTVKFIFQPAEEGAFDYDIWGAKMMVAEGVLEDPGPDAIFGMHVWPFEP